MLPDNTERKAVVGQPLTIDMQAVPGAGYMWVLDQLPPGLEGGEDKVIAQSEEVGGPSLQRFTFVPRQPGDYSLVFSLKRKWEKESARTKAFTIHVSS